MLTTTRHALAIPVLLVLTACAGRGSQPASLPPQAGQPEATPDELAERDDRDAAIERFEEALRREPANAALHVRFATWLNRWHIRGAAAHLDAARGLVHGDYSMNVAIGHEYRLAGEFESCVATFDQVVAQKDGAEVRTERALCKLGLHDDSGADADLRAALAIEPTFPPAHYFLAGRLAVARSFKEAAAEYQAYLSLAPNGSLADEATERLRMAEEAAASQSRGGALATAKLKPAR
jgi:tetratricopeptide (TPR) repeat protein